MLTRDRLLGLTLGALVAAVVLAVARPRTAGPGPAGPILSECDGAIRSLAMAPSGPGRPTTLIPPAGEAGAAVWAPRAGDQRAADDLAAALAPAADCRRSPLAFDGGDLLADASAVFVTPAVARRNLQRTHADAAGLRAALADLTGRPVILLDPAPDHHAAMFMAAAGDGTILVGDPSLARPFLESPASVGLWDVAPDWSPETQALFDTVAAQVAAAGRRVVRIPVVCAPDGRTYLTYVNVIIDQRGGGARTVYLPTYRGADALNAAACRIWQSLGYTVRPVDCTTCHRRFGGLHCLVNVIERD